MQNSINSKLGFTKENPKTQVVEPSLDGFIVSSQSLNVLIIEEDIEALFKLQSYTSPEKLSNMRLRFLSTLRRTLALKNESANVSVYPNGNQCAIIFPSGLKRSLILRSVDIAARESEFSLPFKTHVATFHNDELYSHVVAEAYQEFNLKKGLDSAFSALDDDSSTTQFTRDELLRGFENNEFILNVQPIFNLEGRIPVPISAEVLVRWNHPQKGILSPFHFLSSMERHQLTYELDVYVLKKALSLTQDYSKDLGYSFPFAVNIDSRTFSLSSFVHFAKDIIKSHPSAVNSLHLEITETAVIENNSKAFFNISELQRLGFKISLDDFGSGSTLMSYLTYLSPDQIKIDRSLVDCMFNNEVERKRNIARSMISSILNWAGEMSSEVVDVVVEGIETDNELDQLKKIGVKVGQGFGLAKPMTVAKFRELYWLPSLEEKQG